jgi:hypothetical protein
MGRMIIPNEEYDSIRTKLEKDICVLIFTYSNHNKRLIQVLNKLNEIDIYKIVSFNKNYVPPKESHTLAEVVLSTHKTLNNVNFPWFWHMKYTSALAKELNFKYALIMCGDTYVGNPQRIFHLPDMLGNDDLMSYAYSPKAIGTFLWFTKVSALTKIVSWLNGNWNGQGSAVGIKLRNAVNSVGLKFKLYNDNETHSFFKVKRDSEKGMLVDYLNVKHLYGKELV